MRLFLSLAISVPVGAFFGLCAAYDSYASTPYWHIGIGGAVGVIFGLAVGGVKAKWVDWLYPPGDGPTDDE